MNVNERHAVLIERAAEIVFRALEQHPGRNSEDRGKIAAEALADVDALAGAERRPEPPQRRPPPDRERCPFSGDPLQSAMARSTSPKATAPHWPNGWDVECGACGQIVRTSTIAVSERMPRHNLPDGVPLSAPGDSKETTGNCSGSGQRMADETRIEKPDHAGPEWAYAVCSACGRRVVIQRRSTRDRYEGEWFYLDHVPGDSKETDDE